MMGYMHDLFLLSICANILQSDKIEAVEILKFVLKSTGLRHLSVHILAAWKMRL